MPIIRGFCDWRGPAAPAGVMPLRDEMRGRAALGLRLSLRHNPLVNSVAVCAESPGQTGKGTFWPPIAPAPGRSSVANSLNSMSECLKVVDTRRARGIVIAIQRGRRKAILRIVSIL